MKNSNNRLSITLTGMSLILMPFTACEKKSEQQKINEVRAEARDEIIAAEAKADHARLEAELKITEARRKVEEKTGLVEAPPPVIVIPESGVISQPPIIEKVKDILNVRPNEAKKDRLENRAEKARQDAENAADAADEAAQRADRAARAAGQQ
ncbi:MAG: hypothetical protein ABI600_15365 [Luteolibacter sp.]